MHGRSSDCLLILVILVALLAVALFNRWLKRAPSVQDVREGAQWDEVKILPYTGSFIYQGESPHTVLGNAYVRILYWKLEDSVHKGLEVVACTTKYQTLELMLSCHEGLYQRWYGNSPTPTPYLPEGEDQAHITAIFDLAREHYKVSRPDSVAPE